MNYPKFPAAVALLAFYVVFSAPVGCANPSGPNLVAGSATVQSGGSLTVIHQSSHAAIINWQSFSINPGETTKFIQPSSQSAVLNRVLGGSSSVLDGSLVANGQVFLLNGNGVFIGKSGVVNVEGGFTASTRDISDFHARKGSRRFVGHNETGVENLGTVTSGLGNVVLIGKNVGNHGKITAARGTIGLVAGDNILLGQKRADGTNITVNPSPLAKMGTNTVGVQNSGTLEATSAELKAANGNIYSMAINNSGTIRASTVSRQGGHVWLASDTGLITNTEKINVSASRKGGSGGSAILQSTSGMVTQTGSVLARGGFGGQGGQVDISDQTVELGGVVDTRAAKGLNGNLIISSNMLDIITGGTVMIIGSPSEIDPATLQDYLSDGNVTLSASESISVDSGITWTSANSLSFQTTGSPGTSLSINAPISGPTLTIQMSNSSDEITTGANGAISVGSFILANGNWIQNCATLPAFSSTDFELHGNSSFLRAQGGDGSPAYPYALTDIYGVQGIGSPSNIYLASNFRQGGPYNSDSSVTATWNGGAGFIPIGTFSNPFEGSLKNLEVSDLFISPILAKSEYIGLFGVIGDSGSIYNVNINNSTIQGSLYVGTFAGYNLGLISGCYTYATTVSFLAAAAQNSDMGGIAGANLGSITGCQSSDSITGSENSSGIGGLAGFNSGVVTSSGSEGAVSGGNYTGGLVGYNSSAGNIQACSVMGLADPTTSVQGTSYVGGLVGYSEGASIGDCSASADVTATGKCVGGFLGFFGGGTGLAIGCSSYGSVTGSGASVGGFVGDNQGTISYSEVTSHVPAYPIVIGSGTATGGFAGSNEGQLYSCSTNVSEVSGSTQVGGFVGANYGVVSGCYADGGINYTIENGFLPVICTGTNMVGGFAGVSFDNISLSSTVATVNGVNDVGGFVGADLGSSSEILSSEATGLVFGSGADTGGFIGLNNQSDEIANSSCSMVATGANQLGGFAGQNAGYITGCIATQGSVTANAVSNYQVGGFVGSNLGTGNIEKSYTTEATTAGSGSSDSSEVGGFAGANAGNITTSAAFGGSVTIAGSGSSLGGFDGCDEGGASTSVCYTTESVAGSGCTYVGGFSGTEAGSVSICYSSGQVTGISPGGFIGQLSGGTPIADYWLQDHKAGINAGLPSIGTGGSISSGVTPGTQNQLEKASFYQPNGSSGWDFVSVWGVNGYSSSGQVNNGLPFFQYGYTTVYQITPGNLTSVYNGTYFGVAGSTSVANDSYQASLVGGAITPTDLSTIAAFNPVFGELAASPNVGANQIFLSSATTNSSSVVLEAPAPGILTITPKPITITATSGVSAVYGNPPAFGNDGAAGQLIAGDSLGGKVGYEVAGSYSAGGYLDVGSYRYTLQLTNYNPNYSLSYAPGSVTITPATLTYIANPEMGIVGQNFPNFSGELGGLLPGDSISNATTGTLDFTTTAGNSSPAGFYPINGSGLSASNYVFIQDPTNSTAFTLNVAPNVPAVDGFQPGIMTFTTNPGSLIFNAEGANLSPLPFGIGNPASQTNFLGLDPDATGDIVDETTLQKMKKLKRRHRNR